MIQYTSGYCLGCVDHRTAAHGQHSVDMLPATHLYAFINAVVGRIRPDPAKSMVCHTGSIERRLDSVEQAAADHGTTSINQQHPFTSHGTGLLPRAFFHISPKQIVRRRAKFKIFHNRNKLTKNLRNNRDKECAT